ncbi:MAG: hypothetical protein JNL64_00100 [Blastocatellia bacterium]|nr:hypothetical protein [Blastocatellia bacterium]
MSLLKIGGTRFYCIAFVATLFVIGLTVLSANSIRYLKGVVSANQTNCEHSSTIAENCSRLNIRFLEISNVSVGSGGRQIELFIDEREFNKEKLMTLFSTVSMWYPEDKHLTIRVLTNWNQVSADRFGPNCPGGGSSGPLNSVNKEGHRNAYYARRDGKAYFSFSLDDKLTMSNKIEIE